MTPIIMPCPMPSTPEALRTLLKHALDKSLAIAPKEAKGFTFLLLVEGEGGAQGYAIHGGEVHPSMLVRTYVQSLSVNGAAGALVHDAALADAAAREDEPHKVH